MVAGVSETLTRSSRVIQWGETTNIAVGRTRRLPRTVRAGPARPGSSAKVGAPWETNRLVMARCSFGLSSVYFLASGHKPVNRCAPGSAEHQRNRSRQQGQSEFVAIVAHEQAVLDVHAENGNHHGESQSRAGR